MRKKYSSYRILPARTVSGMGPRCYNVEGESYETPGQRTGARFSKPSHIWPVCDTLRSVADVRQLRETHFRLCEGSATDRMACEGFEKRAPGFTKQAPLWGTARQTFQTFLCRSFRSELFRSCSIGFEDKRIKTGTLF